MADFFGGRGRENGYFESAAGVPPDKAQVQLLDLPLLAFLREL